MTPELGVIHKIYPIKRTNRQTWTYSQHRPMAWGIFFLLKTSTLCTYTLTGFDLTTNSSSLHVSQWRLFGDLVIANASTGEGRRFNMKKERVVTTGLPPCLRRNWLLASSNPFQAKFLVQQ
jgi:hypothetical protein